MKIIGRDISQFTVKPPEECCNDAKHHKSENIQELNKTYT